MIGGNACGNLCYMNDLPSITTLLDRAHGGDQGALEELARLVHGDLLKLANRLMYHRYGARTQQLTLEPAALVNETFMKLLEQRTEFKNRSHFFAIATRVMLRVLADYHKSRHRQKRGGHQVRVSLSVLDREGEIGPSAEIPAVLEALEKLEELDPRLAKVTKLRVLWGLSLTEISEMLGVSRSTIDRDWRFARKWLAANL